MSVSSKLKANFKELYPEMDKEKKRFKRTGKYLKNTAMDRANRNPQKFLEEMTEPSIKNKKGIAF